MAPAQLTETPEANGQTITIRPATAADAVALKRLAELDSAPSLTGEVLVAECGDEAVAAIAIGTGSVIADPFRLTAKVTSMLAIERRGLAGPPVTAPWWRLGVRAEGSGGRPHLVGTGA
ncbi:MAG: hypothetical protein JJE23_02725 [Thermoleophilia bacterium]|nr:hypothetical protein [Thermoleophilia bacterium]